MPNNNHDDILDALIHSSGTAWINPWESNEYVQFVQPQPIEICLDQYGNQYFRRADNIIENQDNKFNGATQMLRKEKTMNTNQQHTIDLVMPNTGEIKQFNITRSGLWNLSKTALKILSYLNTSDYQRIHNKVLGNWWFTEGTTSPYPPLIVELLYTYRGLVNYIGNINGFTKKEQAFINDFSVELLDRARLAWYTMPDLTLYIPYEQFGNLVNTLKGRTLKSEAFQLNDNWYPNKFKKYVRRCPNCGKLFLEQQLMEDDLRMSEFCDISFGDIGYGGFCNDCVEDCYDEESMRKCDYCGKWYPEDEVHYVDSDDMFVSDEYMDWYGGFNYCENCEELINTNNADGYWTDDDTFYCSERCLERAGYHYSNSRDCWTQDYDEDDDEDEYDDEVDSEVVGYHDYYYTPRTSSKDKEHKHPLYSGAELECDDHSRYDSGAEWFRDLRKMLDQKVVFSTDGSLNNGFEMVTMPLTENAFKETNWEQALKYIADEGYRSHDTSTCGLHFHFSSWYLGYNNRQKKDSARKIAYFVNKHWSDVLKFSRRSRTGYCEPFSFDITKDTRWRDLTDTRYHAVNLRDLRVPNEYGDYTPSRESAKDTIEIRICRGTLNHDTFMASWDFFLHIVRNAKKVPWAKIDDLSLWFKGIKSKTTIDYIKSRNCFEGAF